MVQLVFIILRRQFISAVDDFWIKPGKTDPRHAYFIFGHHSNRFILIAVYLKSLFGRQIKKREHVAARNGRDEDSFGINMRWI